MQLQPDREVWWKKTYHHHQHHQKLSSLLESGPTHKHKDNLDAHRAFSLSDKEEISKESWLGHFSSLLWMQGFCCNISFSQASQSFWLIYVYCVFLEAEIQQSDWFVLNMVRKEGTYSLNSCHFQSLPRNQIKLSHHAQAKWQEDQARRKRICSLEASRTTNLHCMLTLKEGGPAAKNLPQKILIAVHMYTFLQKPQYMFQEVSAAVYPYAIRVPFDISQTENCIRIFSRLESHMQEDHK